MSLATFIKTNSPNSKPELWDNLPSALVKQCIYRLKKVAHYGLDVPVQVVYDGDLKFRVNLQDAIGRSIYLYGCYEYATTKLLEQYFRPGMTFFDIGANAGYYSLFAAKRVGDSGAVVSFEPVDSLYDCLTQNVRLNGFSNIKTYRFAVCDRIGQVHFYVVHSKGNSGLSSLQERNYDQSDVEEILVPGITLDQFALDQKISKIDLIKVDVEGCEILVLLGAERILKREIAPDIVFECHQDVEVLTYLESLGYQIYDISYHTREGPILLPHKGCIPYKGYRAYEAPNLFATKSLKDGLERLVH